MNLQVLKRFFLKFIIIFSFSCTSFALESDSLTVLAPKNMSFALTEIIRNYSRNNKVNITGSFNKMDLLLKDIEEGFAADIIITDHPDWIKEFRQKGLVNIASIKNLVEDKLVLITSNSYYEINKEFLENLKNASPDRKRRFYSNFNILIPNQEKDFVGKFALQAARNSKILPILGNQIQTYDNVKNIFSNQKEALAIVKYSEAYDNNNFNILENFDNATHQRFVYQVAAIASENMEDSKKFIEYIYSKESLNIFKKYGFSLIE